jgi:hypothetical protein
MDGDDAILDLAQVAAPLTLNPRRFRPLLLGTGLVNNGKRLDI